MNHFVSTNNLYNQRANSISLDKPYLQKNLKQHKLNVEEFNLIVKILKRAPTFAELGVFSAMWSEHCSYKSSKIHLKKLPSDGKQVVVGPGENAGVIRVSEKLCIAFKMESHNHPSFIEPYQGAATGVGGILRDVFCMGARPIANFNCLRFGEKQHSKTKWLMSNVIKGIGDYGNCVGVPTLGGNISFDPSYNGNILVNAMTVGVISEDEIFKGYASGLGNLIYYLGSATGRDGIHGATMASDSFKKEDEDKRTAVQVGDPFFEKLLLEATLEVLKKKLVVGIQDMGAAGLTSSIFEMASRAKTGVLLDLNKIPTRTANMTPYELLLSESQERMLMVVEKKNKSAIEEVFNKWGLCYSQIGEITDSKKVQAYMDGTLHLDIPVQNIVDNAPVYDRPIKKPIKTSQDKTSKLYTEAIKSLGISECLKRIFNNFTPKESIYEHYDHHIGSKTVIGPEGGGAAVLWLKSELSSNDFLGLSVANSCNERYCSIEPKEGAKHAVYKAARMIAATGAKPSALTDCLNYGNPEDPEVMWQIAQGVEGIKEAACELETPVVSGNVSLYNETNGKSILPTPMIGMVGVINDIRLSVPAQSLKDGYVFLLKGKHNFMSFAGSELAFVVKKQIKNTQICKIEPDSEKEAMDFLSNIITKKRVIAARDIAKGGLITCLLKMTYLKKNLELLANTENLEEFLFSEQAGAYLILSSKENFLKLQTEAKSLQCNDLVLLAKVSQGEKELRLPNKEIINLNTVQVPQNFT